MSTNIYNSFINENVAPYSASSIGVFKVKTKEELLELKKHADEKGISNYLVIDAGRTQIPTSSITVLALGPDEDEIIDEVTGDLKLL